MASQCSSMTFDGANQDKRRPNRRQTKRDSACLSLSPLLPSFVHVRAVQSHEEQDWTRQMLAQSIANKFSLKPFWIFQAELVGIQTATTCKSAHSTHAPIIAAQPLIQLQALNNRKCSNRRSAHSLMSKPTYTCSTIISQARDFTGREKKQLSIHMLFLASISVGFKWLQKEKNKKQFKPHDSSYTFSSFVALYVLVSKLILLLGTQFLFHT